MTSWQILKFFFHDLIAKNLQRACVKNQVRLFMGYIWTTLTRAPTLARSCQKNFKICHEVMAKKKFAMWHEVMVWHEVMLREKDAVEILPVSRSWQKKTKIWYQPSGLF